MYNYYNDKVACVDVYNTHIDGKDVKDISHHISCILCDRSLCELWQDSNTL